MGTVGAREANQRFAELLRQAEGGNEFTITRHGKPVARLGPARARPSEAARKKAVAEMARLMRKGIDLGGRHYSRDEMHDA
ncbi:MAG TPA: type II toxin-antitoxin system prevent-host-death family antitoxin [Rhizomicrobium sp.]|jgi:prevent-host-death family protein